MPDKTSTPGRDKTGQFTKATEAELCHSLLSRCGGHDLGETASQTREKERE